MTTEPQRHQYRTHRDTQSHIWPCTLFLKTRKWDLHATIDPWKRIYTQYRNCRKGLTVAQTQRLLACERKLRVCRRACKLQLGERKKCREAFYRRWSLRERTGVKGEGEEDVIAIGETERKRLYEILKPGNKRMKGRKGKNKRYEITQDDVYRKWLKKKYEKL